MRLTITACVLPLLLFLSVPISCTSKQHVLRRGGHTTLIDYAARAKQRGSQEALVPYHMDEQEGEMFNVLSIQDAMVGYEWIVGEPIGEKTLAWANNAGTDPDLIFTAYRFRIDKRFGQSKYNNPPTSTLLEEKALQELRLREEEVIVLKTGGDMVIDGVLLKKKGSLCFSELLPSTYLLALQMGRSDRVGWLAMGCRSIFSVDGDRLIPREQRTEPVTLGMKNMFNNSLVAFRRAFAKSETNR
jgi:hypothetical protein